jgi:hypothetical protein
MEALGEGCSEGFLGQMDEPMMGACGYGLARQKSSATVSPSSGARAATQASAFTFSSRVAAVMAPA